MTVDQSVTSAILEEVQDTLVGLVNTFGMRGLIEQEAQFEIQDVIRGWLVEPITQPEWLIEELAKEITSAAMECINVEVTFHPNARLAKSVINTQIKLGE
jgi:hypothetical protein